MRRVMMQDPKEATRERIERLKKEGAVEFEEGSGDKGAIPLPKVPVLKQGRAAVSEVRADIVSQLYAALALACRKSMWSALLKPGV